MRDAAQLDIAGIFHAISDLRSSGRTPEAVQLCKHLMDSIGPKPEVVLVAAELAADLEDVKEAHLLLSRVGDHFDSDEERLLRIGILHLRLGAAAKAEEILRKVSLSTLIAPAFSASINLGYMLEMQDRPTEAVHAYDRAIQLNSGHALPFTRRGMLLLTRAFGPPYDAPPHLKQPEKTRGTISVQSIGVNGRFGTQLLQYGFARMYGHAHKLRVEVPYWVGRSLFCVNDPYPSKQRPQLVEDGDDFAFRLAGKRPETLANHDLWGYFCYHTECFRPYQDFFRSLYQPTPALIPLLDEAETRLRARGKAVVGLHLRRGDFGQANFWVAPERWYLPWLRELWLKLPDPVLYIATDDRRTLAAFAEFSPVDSRDLDIKIPGAEYLIDFHMLRTADHVAISNSTFSFVAAMLNQNAYSFVRPDRSTETLIPFAPWDSPVLT